MLEIIDKNAFKVITFPDNLVLITGFKMIILCSVHSIWFVKFVFSAKKWFVKTKTQIMKYESRVFKSNPVDNFKF